jgi:hypothetical protein
MPAIKLEDSCLKTLWKKLPSPRLKSRNTHPCETSDCVKLKLSTKQKRKVGLHTIPTEHAQGQ